jgi:hypothetical protein
MEVNLKSNRSLFLVAIPPIVITSFLLLTLTETTAATLVYIVVPSMGFIAATGMFVLLWMNRRTPFKDIGAGLLVFLLLIASGWIISGVYSQIIGEVPSPSLADAIWIFGYFLLIWLMYSHTRSVGVKFTRSLLIGASLYWVAMSLFLVAFVGSTATSDDLSTLEKIAYSIYPVADVFILFFVAILLSLHRRGLLDDIWFVMMTAMGFWMAADFLYLGATASGAYNEGSLPDILFVCTDSLIAWGFGILAIRRIKYSSIVPIAETDKPEKLEESIKPRITYVIWSPNGEEAFELFTSNLRTGLEGLIVTRREPSTVKVRYKLERTPVLWLATVAGSDSIFPGNLGIITDMITRFLEKGSNTIVLLDGFESIVTHTEFRKALLMVDTLKDITAANQSRLLVAIDPRTLSEKERALVSSNSVSLGTGMAVA